MNCLCALWFYANEVCCYSSRVGTDRTVVVALRAYNIEAVRLYYSLKIHEDLPSGP